MYSFCRCSGVVRQQMVKLGLDFRDWGLHSWGFWAVERFAPAPKAQKDPRDPRDPRDPS